MAHDWIRKLDRSSRVYKEGTYTILEFRALAIDLMPFGGAAELIAHLPDDVVISVKKLLVESASWTDEEWDSLVSVNGPETTPDSRHEYRRKLNELRAYFDG